MNTIPNQENVLEKVGSFIGGKVVDATAVAGAIVILKSKIKDPQKIAGAFALYVTAKRSGQVNGAATGREFDKFLKEEYNIDTDKFVNDNINKLNEIIEEYKVKIDETLFNNAEEQAVSISEKQNSLTQDERTNLAQMINAGGLPWNYNSQQAQQIIRVYDPLALDLNHNGKIDTTNANTSSAFFDMDNNGMSEITGWIDKEDGLLVYDKNNNGKIDNINELFGNENKDGYRELRELINSNGDNVIDKNDTKFKDLKIWQDLNGDGISQNNELKTLDELNITSINLNSKNTNIDDNGNNIFKTSTFTQNGQEYLSGDVNFAVDKRFTDYRGEYTLSVDALFLPWLRGYGDVKDAHIAYSMDEEFKEFTKTLVGDDEKAYNEFDTFLKNNIFTINNKTFSHNFAENKKVA